MWEGAIIKTQFFIELKEEIKTKDFSNLRLLYTPIIGKKATILFETLFDYYNLYKNSKIFAFLDEILKALNFSSLQFETARKKLEAVGLVRSYEKASNKSFIFLINRPLEPRAFHDNTFLYRKLVSIIGEIQFEKIELHAQKKIMKKDDYREITSKYQDLYELDQDNENITNTLEVALPKFQSKEAALATLNIPQFVFYLTEKRISPSQLHIFQSLRNSGFTSKSLNLIIDYSFTINSRIVANHIKKIAEDFLEKDIKDPYDVALELETALANKALTTKKMQTKIEKQNGNDSSLDHKEWNDLIESIGGL